MKSIAYLVSSHFSYSTLALPILLESMRNCGIPAEHIFVIVCGCKREFDQRGPDCTFWFVNHESRNFCTFVEAISPARANALADFEHVFCLLDTCKAGPDFRERSQSFDRGLDAVAANPHTSERLAQSDLAAYSLVYLRSQSRTIETFRNAPSVVNLDWEGRIFRLAPRRDFYCGDSWDGMRVVCGPEDVYGTGTARITEYYHSVDLIHFKSNWGQHGRNLSDRI